MASSPATPPPSSSVISSAAIPIIVAVIGVVGILLPPLINNITEREPNHPDIDIRTPYYNPLKDTDLIQPTINITNKGDAPATNLSVMLNTFPMEVVNITNRFSTTEITLSQLNNTVLETGYTETINRSLLESEFQN
jgi:hypothetical protein